MQKHYFSDGTEAEKEPMPSTSRKENMGKGRNLLKISILTLQGKLEKYLFSWVGDCEERRNDFEITTDTDNNNINSKKEGVV